MEAHIKDADRWLRQSEADIKSSEWCLEGGFFSQSCFLAQQSAAKALRAYLYLKSEDTKETRSVVELLVRAITYDETFKEHVENAGRIDLYYKTARFPDAIPGGIPSEVISDRDAMEAIKVAGDIIKLVEDNRKNYMPDTM
ncbi:MAG: HEPN domain-containing protein [Deltaproteobacteria bacterium]|nr:HEPN domain-containing protein [Deltaproteobacteria bacterium]